MAKSRKRGVGRPRKDVPTDTMAGRVAHNIRRIRESAGRSVEDCAEAAGIDRATWYRLEDGKHPSTMGKFTESAAAALGVSLSELLKAVPKEK